MVRRLSMENFSQILNCVFYFYDPKVTLNIKKIILFFHSIIPPSTTLNWFGWTILLLQYTVVNFQSSLKVFAIHWRYLGLRSKDEHKAMDQNFRFYSLIFTAIIVEQLRTWQLIGISNWAMEGSGEKKKNLNKYRNAHCGAS